MKQNSFYFSLVYRVVFLAFSLFLLALFTIKQYWFSVTFICIVCMGSLFEIIQFIKNYLTKNQKIINALLHNDFSLNISKNQFKKDNSTLKLYYKIKEEHTLNSSKEILYHHLLNAVSSGFLILKREADDRKILFMNAHFQEIFGVPKSSSWNYLKKFIPQFCETLEEKEFEDIKTTIDIQIDGEERQTYLIQNTKAQITNDEYDIIFLDSIQRVIDSTEKEAWMNVMKVIAHEIINSLTPIHSLANTTKMYFENENLDKSDYDDIRLSLETIMNRSQHLQTFVEQYRQLTMLPTPIKSTYYLNEIIQSIEQSFSPEFHQKQILFENHISTNVKINVDRIQFEQVMINLIKNAIYSVENVETKLIEIFCKQTENRLQIIIQDSGHLIDEAILPKIFLPFYTTRKDGAGIGLTLSKNIIEAHKGYLYYQQDKGVKRFNIILT